MADYDEETAGKVRYILNVLNGSYLTGYSDMNKKPFEPLLLASDGFATVKEYIEKNSGLYGIAKKTIDFLNGFYSDFALELLSSIDFITTRMNTFDKNVIEEEMSRWNDRKGSMVTDLRYIDISLRQLQRAEFA